MMTNSKPLLALCMIVKDEEEKIAGALNSVKDIIDFWVVKDTGSTDGTVKVIEKTLAGIPGKLLAGPLVDFSTARNSVFDEVDEKTVFTLVLDGKEILHGADILKKKLEALRDNPLGAYYLTVADNGETYAHTRIARTSAGWRYSNPVHEVLTCPGGQTQQAPFIGGVSISRGPGSRERRRQRWHQDLAMLRRHRDLHPDHPRTTFYIAQTLDCLGRHVEAVEEYRHRVSFSDNTDEFAEAHLCLARVQQSAGFSWAIVQDQYLRAFSVDRSRAEPLYEIAVHYHHVGDDVLAFQFALNASMIPTPTYGTRPFYLELYQWKIADMIAMHAKKIGELDAGRLFAERALEGCGREEQKERLRSQLEDYSS